MEKITVIGGGASGLMAAIYACSPNTKVTILERNDSCGKKLLATGNGKCNYWNDEQSLTHYHGTHPEIIKNIVTKEHQQEVLSFFHQLGIIPKIKNGYYYPFSNQATTIKRALLLEAKRRGVKVRNGVFVTKIEKHQDEFKIHTNQEILTSDKVIISTGSKAAPKTGSDGNGYDLLKSLNHSIIQVNPALVQLLAKTSFLKDWAGIRTDVILTLYENDKKKKEESGEVQLTKEGISGICTFNLSRDVAIGLKANKIEKVDINFLPFLNTASIEEVEKWFKERDAELEGQTIGESLEGILNYKLVSILLKESKVSPIATWNEMTKKQKDILLKNLLSFELKITGTQTFEQAQVCSGGIPLQEIKEQTMESKKQSGLFITGELLDVDGDCGGYNLGFAWITGMIAGISSKGETNA